MMVLLIRAGNCQEGVEYIVLKLLVCFLKKTDKKAKQEYHRHA
jgi:hypothetical protein